MTAGRPAAIYGAAIFGGEGFGGERGTVADAFVADAAWHRASMPAVGALLGLWEEGLAAWKQDSAQIVADYPHHFAIETDAEIAWLADYVTEHDWVVPSVYISEQEAETHNFAFERLVALGLVPADAAPPEFDLSYSPALSVLEGSPTPGPDEDDAEGGLGLPARQPVHENGSRG